MAANGMCPSSGGAVNSTYVRGVQVKKAPSEAATSTESKPNILAPIMGDEKGKVNMEDTERKSMSIINVTYRKDNGEYSLGRYSYYCEIPDIAVGDVVIAPTSNGDRAAKVMETNVPESKIDERILPLLKTVTQREEPADENN